MGEVKFYHLTDQPLERTLPVMLTRTLERRGRAVVRGTVRERLAFLDGHLWTYADESFLPHGIEGSEPGTPEDQPIWLALSPGLPNGARTLFLIDGADPDPDECRTLETVAILFDGHDPAAVETARNQWRQVTANGLQAVYWATEGGRWVRKAESKANG